MGEMQIASGLMIGLLNYVAGRFGSEDEKEKEKRAKARQEFLMSLDEEIRAIFIDPNGKSRVVPRNITLGYPLFSRMLEGVVQYAVKHSKGLSETDVCTDIGAKSAERDFGSHLRLYDNEAYKVDPKLVYNATPVIWPRMYVGSEIRVTNFEQDVHVDFEISRFPDITRKNCLVIGAWIYKACNMISGLEGTIQVEHKPKTGIDCRIKFEVTKVTREIRQ